MTDEVLSASAMALYERLVAAAVLPIGPGDTDAGIDNPAVRELLDAGFAELSNGTPPQLRPVAPVTAFGRVLTELQDEFLGQQKQLLDAYTYLDGLQQHFLETQPAPDADSLVQVRPEDGAFGEALSELLSSAEAEILCWNIALQRLTTSHPAAERPAHVRTVYDAAFLHREGGATTLRQARAAGQELRIADDLASSMLIVDSAAVMLPLDATTSGVLVIRSPLVVDAMREFFELTWQRAVPWTDRDRTDEVLTPIQRHVVALMAVGHSDEEVGEYLGISLRTVRRHVADVMERLGADTRFAAGIAAAKAGLLDDAALPPVDTPS